MRVIKYGAPWCGPCKMLTKELEKLKETNPAVVIVDINVEDQPQLAAEMGIRSVPVLIIDREDGSPRFVHNGLMTKAMIVEKLGL